MKRRFAVFAGFLAVVLATGCRKNTEDEFREIAQKEEGGWTQDQIDVAFPEGEKQFHLKKSGNAYEYNYGVLKTADVRKQADEVRRDYAGFLDFKNEEVAQYLDVFGLRKYAEHKEEVWEAIGARLLLAELYERFQKSMGVGMSFGDPELDEAHNGRFNLKKIFSPGDIAKTFPFASTQIEEARRQGRLKVVSERQFKAHELLYKKEPDPAKLDDPNEFIWRDFKGELVVTAYKILDGDKPKDSFPNYIEGYRVSNGKAETLPAIRIFFPNSGPGVLVVDTDQEGRDAGYGIPDMVAPTGHRSAQDVVDDKALLALIFEAKSEKRRRIPPTPKIAKVEIVKVGEGSAADPWEKAADSAGWKVPATYKNPTGKNFNVKLKFVSREKLQPQGDDSQQLSSVKQIESFIKEWTGGDRYTPSQGAAKEYYRPKAEFAQRNIEKAEVRQYEDTKRVVVTFADGTERAGMVTAGANQFTEDNPWAIEYTDGAKRFRIEKSQGSKVFDKKRQIALPKDAETGVYGANGESESSDPNASSVGGRVYRKP